jgi:hypothetical protein
VELLELIFGWYAFQFDGQVLMEEFDVEAA